MRLIIIAGLLQKRIQTGGVEDIFFFNFIPGNSRENKAQPLNIPQNCITVRSDPLEIPRPKAKIPGNSTFFFVDPWKFHFVFN